MSLFARKGFPQDFIFREETRQTGRSRDGQGSDKHRPERHRNLVLQSAHLPHVLFVMHRMDDAAAAKEQERLEEGMRHEVEDAGCKRADTKREKHVTELAHGGVSKHAFDVILNKCDRCGEECRNGADHRDHRHGLWRHLINKIAAGNHVNAGSNHRRRVNQRADRSWTFHRIGKPDVQRNLSRLTRGSHK